MVPGQLGKAAPSAARSVRLKRQRKSAGAGIDLSGWGSGRASPGGPRSAPARRAGGTPPARRMGWPDPIDAGRPGKGNRRAWHEGRQAPQEAPKHGCATARARTPHYTTLDRLEKAAARVTRARIEEANGTFARSDRLERKRRPTGGGMILTAGDRGGQAQAAREAGQPGGGLARPDRRGSIGQAQSLRLAEARPVQEGTCTSVSCSAARTPHCTTLDRLEKAAPRAARVASPGSRRRAALTRSDRLERKRRPTGGGMDLERWGSGRASPGGPRSGPARGWAGPARSTRVDRARQSLRLAQGVQVRQDARARLCRVARSHPLTSMRAKST